MCINFKSQFLSQHIQSLMVDIELSHFSEKSFCCLSIVQAQISKPHHQITMYLVAQIEIVLPNQQIG